MHVSVNNLTLYTAYSYTQLYTVHSSQLYLDHLSCNQTLCMEIKVEGLISFKSAESIADSHEFRTIHQLQDKKLFRCTTLLPAFVFFSCGTSLVQTISKKPNQTSLCQSPKPLLTSFPLKKLIDSIAKLHMKKLKLDQVNNCIFFLNCYCQHELRFPALYPHIIFNFLRHSCSLENGKKIIYCIVSLEYLRLQ